MELPAKNLIEWFAFDFAEERVIQTKVVAVTMGMRSAFSPPLTERVRPRDHPVEPLRLRQVEEVRCGRGIGEHLRTMDLASAFMDHRPFRIEKRRSS